MVIAFFNFPASEQNEIKWGVNFSPVQVEALKLDGRTTYLAILDDLRAKNIKLLTHWNKIGEERGSYDFSEVDWQIEQAQKYNAEIVYVLGMKTGRWPECHLPDWVKNLDKEEQQEELLRYIKEVVLRYKDSGTIIAWQVENEPFFKFGSCPWYDGKFLRQEIETVKSLDPARPVIISDSGEQSLWIKAGAAGDIVGTTLYRKIWVHLVDGFGFYTSVPLPPVSYWLKGQLINKLFGKEVINVELQAEPWSPKNLSDTSLKEQEKTMSLEKFRSNVSYAKRTGLKEFYFWGAEWWYWLKEKQDKPEIWEEAKKILQEY